VLFFGALVYVNNNAGGFDAIVYAPFDNALAVTNYPRSGGPAPEVKNGEKLFSLNCAACHQTAGTGDPSKGCPPLDGSDWVQAAGPNRLVRIVLNGLQGPLVVNEKPWGTGVMTPFGSSLNDEQIADVLSYVRQAWSNKSKKFELVTPAQVKAIRAQPKEGNWQPADLLKIAEKDEAAPAAK